MTDSINNNNAKTKQILLEYFNKKKNFKPEKWELY